MIGKIFITSTGYDPQLGKHVKDPYLGPCPTLGACRHDLRQQLNVDDHIFVVSGKVQGVPSLPARNYAAISKEFVSTVTLVRPSA